MAAAAIDAAEQAKWDAYTLQVAKRPKQDRRAFAASGPQTRFIMLAVTQWFEWFMDIARVGGLPRENVLYRAALLIPRSPNAGSSELSVEPPRIVSLIEKAVADLDDSHARILIANEQVGHLGIDRVAHRLKMSTDTVKNTLKEARRSIASHLRGAGVTVPREE
jgi:DNA-directed RNA polymerase specialized sigma24 family protein